MESEKQGPPSQSLKIKKVPDQQPIDHRRRNINKLLRKLWGARGSA